jgi:hypothetical protein
MLIPPLNLLGASAKLLMIMVNLMRCVGRNG